MDYKDHEFDPSVSLGLRPTSETNETNNYIALRSSLVGMRGCLTWSTSRLLKTSFSSAKSACGSPRSTGLLLLGAAQDTSPTARMFTTRLLVVVKANRLTESRTSTLLGHPLSRQGSRGSVSFIKHCIYKNKSMVQNHAQQFETSNFVLF